MKILIAVLIGLSVCAGDDILGYGTPRDSAAAQRLQLNRRIPAADAEKYKDVRDGRDWLNPKLTIYADGILVEGKGISGRKVVAPADLPRTLVALPVDAWPYGRVVMASDIGIREPDGKGDEQITRNHNATEKALKALDVVIDWWPS